MATASLPRRRSRFSLAGTLAAVGGAFLCGILVVRLQLPMLERINLGELENAEARKNRNIALANTLGWLGYRNLGASWLWLELIQYYGDAPARTQTGYGLAYDYFDHMLRLDPHFLLGYRLSSLVLAYRAGQPEKAVEILDRGLQQFKPPKQP
jgi:tetratricopeptide (TPR) repeat protein